MLSLCWGEEIWFEKKVLFLDEIDLLAPFDPKSTS